MLRISVATLLLVFSCCGFAAGHDLYPFAHKADQVRFQHLTQQLRCLVCQNETLADSNAKLAKDLRGQVYHMVLRGESNQHIKQYLVQRYGNFVLFKPPLNRMTFLLWAVPSGLLIFAVLLLFIIVRQRQSNVAQYILSELERQRAED